MKCERIDPKVEARTLKLVTKAQYVNQAGTQSLLKLGKIALKLKYVTLTAIKTGHLLLTKLKMIVLTKLI